MAQVETGNDSWRFKSRTDDHTTTRARPVSATPTSSDGASANRSKRKKVRIPTMPTSRSSESRSFIPIDPDQCGVGTPLDAFLISVFSPDVKYG